MDRLRLDVLLNATVGALYERIEAHRELGGLLDDVETLMKGRRTSHQLNRPLLAIVPAQARPVVGARGSTALTQTFSFNLRIHAQVINNDEIEGQELAAALAGRAMYAAVTMPGMSFQNGHTTMLGTPVGEVQMDFGTFDYSIASPNDDTLFEARSEIVFPRLKATY